MVAEADLSRALVPVLTAATAFVGLIALARPLIAVALGAALFGGVMLGASGTTLALGSVAVRNRLAVAGIVERMVG